MKSTVEIAADAVAGNDRANEAALADLFGQPPRGALTPMVAMPMDMDFGHYEGYSGREVYERVEGKKGFVFRQWELASPRRVDPAASVVNMRPVITPNPKWKGSELESLSESTHEMDEEELDLYVPYLDQVEHTLLAAARHPWRILPFFHYDPRRWCEDGSKTPTAPALRPRSAAAPTTGPWNFPFERYFGSPDVRPFLGIKMYTALGYRPRDPRLPLLSRFYEACSATGLDLPITCHCSPGGFYSLERPLYVLRDAQQRADGRQWLEEQRRWTLERMESRGLETIDWESYWFSERYVSPAAWLEVLRKYPTLRLCLAHFGNDEGVFTRWSKGDPDEVRTDLGGELSDETWASLSWEEGIVNLALRYENVYTDVSCIYFDRQSSSMRMVRRLETLLETYPALRRKIIFGTDWWMTVKDGFNYDRMAHQARMGLTPFARRGLMLDPELWDWFSCINPARFLRLRERARAFEAWLTTQKLAKVAPDVARRGREILESLAWERS